MEFWLGLAGVEGGGLGIGGGAVWGGEGACSIQLFCSISVVCCPLTPTLLWMCRIQFMLELNL